MSHNYKEPGPMTRDEMREWMADKQNRRVNDLCLVAWGYHPDSPEGKSYNFNEDEGVPERMRNTIFEARRLNQIWAEKMDGEDFFRMDRNDFAEWLKSHPIWRKEPPCIRFINAWKEYRSQTQYPDTKPHNQAERVRRAIDAVREASGVAEVNAAARLIFQSEEYAHYRDYLRYTKGPNKGQLLNIEDVASAYSSKPSQKGQKNPVGKK